MYPRPRTDNRARRGSLARRSHARRFGLVVLLLAFGGWARTTWAAQVQIVLALNGQAFAPGSTLTLTLSVEAPGSPARGDLYLAALTPSQTLVFLGPGFRPSTSPVPFDVRRTLSPGNATLGNLPLGSAIFAGPYRVFALVVQPGTSPLEPANALSNLAAASFTFGAPLSRDEARRIAEQAVETPSLILRTVSDNTRAVLRTLAALRAGPGRSATTPCPQYTTLEAIVAADRSGVTFSVLVDYGAGCRDDDDGELRRGAYLARFEITRFDRRTLEPVAGEATLLFSDFVEGDSSISGLVTDAFAPDRDEITGLTTETSPQETLTLLYNLTSTFDRVVEVEYLNGAVFLQSSVDGERAALFEDTAFDQLTEVDAFTCADPIGGRITIGDQSDFAVLRFGLPNPGCGFAYLSLNGGPEELIRLTDEASTLRAASRTQRGGASLSRASLRGINAARRARPKAGR